MLLWILGGLLGYSGAPAPEPEPEPVVRTSVRIALTVATRVSGGPLTPGVKQTPRPLTVRET
jgi:hypothetical protein